MLFWIGHAEAAKRKRSVVKINASALWWSAPTDLGISHSRFFLSWHHRKNITTEEKNNLLKTIRDRKEGLLIYTASGTKQDAVNNHSLAACDMVNAAIPQPYLCRCFLPHGSFKGRIKNNKIYISSRIQFGWKSRLLVLIKQTKTKVSVTPCRSRYAYPSTSGCAVGASSTCLSSDSSPSCIKHMHVWGAEHSTLLCVLMGSQHL